MQETESTASHTFRVAIFSWLLGEQRKLKTERLIKIALVHDMCEVFTERTLSDPGLLNQSSEEKKQRAEEKRKKKQRALSKLTSGLFFQQQFEGLYSDLFEEVTEEAKFVEQTEKAENYLQALEYWAQGKNIDQEKWTAWANQVFDNPYFIKLKRAIERRFLGKSKTEAMDNIIDFLIEIGTLKIKPRKGWILIGKENPGTIAEHSYRTAVMAWILGEKTEVNLDLGKIIKTALIHDTCEARTYDKTPYDGRLPEDKEKWPDLFDRWPRASKEEKKESSLEKDEREIDSVKQLTSGLPPTLKEEISKLQLDYIKKISEETRFVKQINRLEALLQALEYGEEDQRRPFRSWWVGTKELVDNPTLVEFLESLDEKFKHLEESYPRRTLETAS